ncbi:outer membrane protein assembly factor BamB family protein, partial [Streptomyces sp. URMC 124]|uniref:outer membrane protein assembly factor BamB family protein n=1 Tax=Streptomyces sp. URMC 124 TaxID=3423405 RepID=UPI003F1E1C63
YPALNSNPYAQQPGPYGAYPPPGQPFGAPPPAGPPAGGADKKRTALVIGAAVAVLLAAGGGVWALAGSGGDDPRPPQASASASPGKMESTGGDTGGTAGLREAEDDDDPNSGRQEGEAKILVNQDGPRVERAGSAVPGVWAFGDYVVKTVQEKVVAYSTSDGKEKWTITLPKRVCAAPAHVTDDGKVVVAYDGDTKDTCGNYAMLDLKEGKKGWDKPIPKAGGFAESFIGLDMALSGNAVAAAWFGGSGMLRVSDGEPISTPGLEAGCSVDGFAGGKAMLRSWRCVSDETSHIEKLDTSTGKPEWTYDGRKGLETKKIYSSEPAVVSLSSEDKKSAAVIALKDGKERSVIDLGKDTYAPTCGLSIMGHDLGGCQGVAATDNTLYLPTGGEDSYSTGNEIHAFDLDTGKRKWASKRAKPELMPLRAEGDKVYAYRKPSYDKAGAVVSIGPDGDPKVVLQAPKATMNAENMFFSARYLYEGDRLFKPPPACRAAVPQARTPTSCSSPSARADGAPRALPAAQPVGPRSRSLDAAGQHMRHAACGMRHAA